jgi:hypothetical protein
MLKLIENKGLVFRHFPTNHFSRDSSRMGRNMEKGE